MDPLFAGSASYDFSLLSSSPCIDAGSPDSVYNDPDGTRNDVGGIYFDQNVVYLCGDANDDGSVNIFDVTFVISYLYLDGPSPDPLWIVDVNNDSAINIFDVTDLIGFLYLGGSEPNCP